MADKKDEAAELLLDSQDARPSMDSVSSASTTSLIFQRISERQEAVRQKQLHDNAEKSGVDEAVGIDENEASDLENGPFLKSLNTTSQDKTFRRILWVIGSVFVAGWLLALMILLGRKTYLHSSETPHDPTATASRGNGKQITLDQVMGGKWSANIHDILWIEGAHGEDGLLLERGAPNKDYLVVEGIMSKDDNAAANVKSTTLMKSGTFRVGEETLYADLVVPSKDLKKVLVSTDRQSNWRHSFYARYWIFDVETQKAEPLDPINKDRRVQLASWSPQSDAIAFTRDNNLFIRTLSPPAVVQITNDGGSQYFYGIPDWVYEEEVFGRNSATWWSDDGKHIAFLRTNESLVPEYPIQYFLSRPSGDQPAPGEENYPEVREIKYPKAGAPNPIVDLLFYDVAAGETFEAKSSKDAFEDSDRLITEVVWAGSKALIRETNRDSDILRVVLVDVLDRKAQTVRTVNVSEIDGGWFEVSQKTQYIPADPSNGRPHDGYIDTVIHKNYDHLGYFTPLNNSEPILLTSGNWEVVDAPSAIDLENNLVYFIATKESSIQRHVYSVNLNGSNLQPFSDISAEGYYRASFSSGAGYALLTYAGPNIPWQKIVSTPSNKANYSNMLEDNAGLSEMARKHQLPIEIYDTVNIDGFELNVVERRPPHFDARKKYPVLFYLYGGPGSQTVSKTFSVDFESFVAANLGYVVVTVDGRGTGFIGREARCIIRGNLGYYEAHDQIEAAKMWAKKAYVDASRMAIWGWSYGGFMTLKTLEQDAGQTFSYGMAVAPVTDWRFYDSIYTERYMHTPQENPTGYDNSSITNMTALHQNVRFLVMHGIADDNVHMQSTLTLLDKLDVAGIENYDVHVFPDSNHSIYFHNANRIVYDKLVNWLVNAFNGEWLRVSNAKPLDIDSANKA